MRISMIAAIGKNRELGKHVGGDTNSGVGDRLLWDIPEDGEFFRSLTRGHACIMGRKTFESLMYYFKGKPIPGRISIVVTRDEGYSVPDGCYVFTDIKEAVEFAKKEEERLSLDPKVVEKRDSRAKQSEVFVIGGAQMYALAMPFADRLYLTFVDGEFPEADAFFPEYPEFTKVINERKSSGNGFTYTFKTLEK